MVEEDLNRLSTNHRKTAYKLTKSVARLCSRYGIERIGFLTLTFTDDVRCHKEAGRRFNSLRTGVLAHRYCESICVIERMQSGVIHFHLLVVVGGDIRTGFNFEELKLANRRRRYRSANPFLRSEWKYWRSITNYNGKHPHHPYAIFGRCEMLPVRSNDEGISNYVGKYIAKHVGHREERDKGVRLVRYSRGARIGSNAFMFVSPRSRLWRWQVGEFARRNNVSEDDFPAMAARFGRRWAWSCRERITAIEPPPLVCAFTKDREPLTLWDLWESDRASLAQTVAGALGCDPTEAYAGLFQGVIGINSKLS
jgi:hypothetical protein